MIKKSKQDSNRKICERLSDGRYKCLYCPQIYTSTGSCHKHNARWHSTYMKLFTVTKMKRNAPQVGEEVNFLVFDDRIVPKHPDGEEKAL